MLSIIFIIIALLNLSIYQAFGGEILYIYNLMRLCSTL